MVVHLLVLELDGHGKRVLCWKIHHVHACYGRENSTICVKNEERGLET